VERFWPTSAKSSMVCFSKRFEIIGRAIIVRGLGLSLKVYGSLIHTQRVTR
jgi:hypothetical protein